MGWKTDTDKIEGTIKHLGVNVDKHPNDFLMRLCRAMDMPTPEEKKAEMSEGSLQSQQRSAIAAEQSAEQSRKSVEISIKAEAHARWSKWVACIAALIAALSLLLDWIWK